MGRSCLSISALLVLTVIWKPALTDDACSLGCKGSNQLPSFLARHKYNYAVDGTVTVFLTGAERQETSLKLSGHASVTALGNCGYVLKTQGLTIIGPDSKRYPQPPGLEKPVQFTIENGKVGPEICSEAGDTRRSLNIKRALISLLQTENKPSTQIDVFGACPTEVSSSQEADSITLLHRSRDLSRCGLREQGNTGLLNAVYNPTAEIKETSVLQSVLNVESKLKQGIPQKVSAIEEYLYKPFSVGENGARAKVHTKLTLLETANGGDSGHFTETHTLIFENPHGHKMDQSNAQTALASVKETARVLTREASLKSAGSFAQVIRIFRTTNKQDLLNIYNQVKGNSLERRVFLDALFRTGTAYSIQATIDIFKRNEYNDIEKPLALLSLANARHVDDDALKAAASLLDVPNLPEEVYLGVGAVAGVYCRNHFCHDGKSQGIVSISQKFVAQLQNCKTTSKVAEDKLMTVLKGVRNIQHLENHLIDKLVQCANNQEASARVRVAAIEAFQADPCAAKLKKTGIDLLKNRQLDSEIRIKAYLSVIACPCAKSANEIKTLLDSEPVHQVGRFITSSLRFIRTSTNPDKQLARQHYGLIHTPKKFNVDDRKYSFYREASYNIDALGLGGNVEETVIYSQDSFLPRSASLNVTTELFGHSVNILEIGGRQGNLDRVLEHFLGPKSFLRTDTPQSIYDNLKRRFEEARSKVRGRRSVPTEIENFDKRIKEEATPYNNELDLDVYLKLFGTNAVFLSFGDNKGFDFNKVLDELMKSFNKGINELKRFQHELRANLLFLDAELAYPTSTGLPLKLDLIGSATGRVEVATNIDVIQCLRNPENAKVDIKLVPSSDIEITGLFIIDGDSVATGLKVTSNLHSSTGGHLVAKVLENGRGFDLQFALPLEKQEILTASSDLVYVTAEKGQKIKETPITIDTEIKEYNGCFDQLAGLLGLTLCGEVSVPFLLSGPHAQASISKFLARYPLTGPAKLKLVLEKSDLRGYHVKGLFRQDQNKDNLEILFEVEGARTRRAGLNAELVHTNDEKSLTFKAYALDSFVSGELGYYNKPSELALLAKLSWALPEQTEIYAKLKFDVEGNNRRKVYKPFLEYNIPVEGGNQQRSAALNGQLIVETNGPETIYTIDNIKFNFQEGTQEIEMNGHLKRNPSLIEFDVKAKNREHNLILSGSQQGRDVKLEFKNTLNPFINFKIKAHSEFGETIHNEIDLYYSGDCNDPNNRAFFKQLLKYHKGTHETTSIVTKNKFEIYTLPLKIEFDAEFDPKKTSVNLEGSLADKKLEFELDGRTHIKKEGDYTLKLKAGYNEEGIEAFAKRDIVTAEKSNFENYIEIKRAGKYELSGVVLHKNKPNDVNIGAVGHLKITAGSNSEDIKFDVGVIETGNMYSSHAKISDARSDLIDYLLKINMGANANGQLKFNIKDAINTNGQFRVTDNDGRGNGLIIVDFKKAQRKIKGDVKFVAKDPIFNAEVDLFFNFERDNNDKLHFTTENKKTQDLILSKNSIIYGGKKAELNINQEGLDFGKTHANVEVVLPTERCFTLKVDRDLTLRDDVYNGEASFLFSDAPRRGSQASTVSYKSKLNNCNFEKDIINYEGQMEIKFNNGKQLQNNFYLKNIPEGERSKFDFKTDLTGNLIPQPASLSAYADYVTDVTALEGIENYKLKGNYGSEFNLELTGREEVKLSESGHKKYQDNSELTLRLPLENCHDIKLVSNVLFLQNSEHSYEFAVGESVQVNADVYKLDSNGKFDVDKDTGNAKIKLLIPRVDPITLDVDYKFHLAGPRKTGNVDLKASYGRGKTSSIAFEEIDAPQDYTLKLKAVAPQRIENFGQAVELVFGLKTPAPETYGVLLEVDVDNSPFFKGESLSVLSDSHPLLDIKYKCKGSDQISRLYLKGDYLSRSNAKFEIKIENINAFNYVSTSEVNIDNNNFIIKYNGNSEQLGLKNFKYEISSKEAGNGKRLELHATNDNKNIISGSTSYISKQEGPKLIIEGSGTVKIREEQKSANFKYIRTLLTDGNEQGVETFLNLAFGERSYVAEYRFTNLEYKYSYVYCEEKKQCAHVELNSKINTPRPGSLEHLLNVMFDMRKVGIAPEFGLQVKNEVSDDKLPQYSLDLHINKEDKKYHLHIYSQPEFGRLPAGITITLPQRILSLESLISYPTNRPMPFPIHGEINLFLDKRRSPQKIAGRFTLDAQGNENEHTALAEFGFTHPKLGNEVVAKFREVLQRRNENVYKYESTASFSYPPFGSDRNYKIFLEVSPVSSNFLFEVPFGKILTLETKTILNDNLQQGELKFRFFEGKEVSVTAIAKEFKYFELTSRYSDDQQRKLSIIGHIEPEKRIDISADIYLPGGKKNIVNGAVFLKDNLVKSEYGLSKDNLNYFLQALKSDLTNLEGRVKNLGDKTSNEFKELLRKAEPTFKQLEQSYNQEVEKIVQEISNDQVLRELSQTIGQLYHYLAKMIVEVIEVTKPYTDKAIEGINQSSKKIVEMFERQIEPQLKELYANVAAIIKTYFEGLIEMVAHFAALVSDFIEKHRPELEELTNIFTDIFKNLTKLLVAQLKELREKFTVFFANLTEQFKEMPLIAMLKEKWEELAVPEQIIAQLHSTYFSLRDSVPATEESKQFTDALYNYIEKKIRQTPVDDTAEIKVLYEKLIAALASYMQQARNQFNQLGLPSLVNFDSMPKFFSSPSYIPSMENEPSFSILNQLLKGELPDPLSVLRAYRIRYLNPLDEVPSKLRAVVVNGQHIFTFDGRHLTFPGNCRYILAHDFADRNFTLVLQLQNGQPKSLMLEDKSGALLEIKENGQAALNGANHPFPIIGSESFAFREANGRIGLGSKYGVMAFCTSKLEVCYFEVSGFYLGKLRGLLGDGNNEPFDDFTMPNGRIVTSESDFGNAYRMVTSCPQVRSPEHSHHEMHGALPPACEQVFGGTSPLKTLSLVLDIAPFRQACIHAVAANQANALQQACDLGRGYAALALTGMLPTFMPRACVKCTDMETPKEVGDTYEVKLPGKQADIVITFETTKSNEKNFKDLVVPLVAQVVNQLKGKHVDDIKIYLVGITPEFPYPIIYDTDLRIGNAKVHFDDLSRYKKSPTIVTGDEKIDEYTGFLVSLIDVIKIKLGLTNVVASYERTLELPLRPTAVKHYINVVGQACIPQDFVVSFLRSIAYNVLFSYNGYTHTLVTVTNDLKIGNGKNAANIVGFSDDAVFMLGDRRQSKEAEALRPTLKFDDDSCIDFVRTTGGVVISANNYLALNNAQQKQFLQTATQTILHQLLDQSFEQECVCSYVDPFKARTVCFTKQRKEIARRRR